MKFRDYIKENPNKIMMVVFEYTHFNNILRKTISKDYNISSTKNEMYLDADIEKVENNTIYISAAHVRNEHTVSVPFEVYEETFLKD